MDPGAHVILLPIIVESTVYADEDVLGCVFGLIHVSKNAERVLENRPIVPPDDLVEFGLFTDHLGCPDGETDRPPPI
jgi:hypothetical protein